MLACATSTADEIMRMDVTVVVRRNTSGGWHGLYDIKRINFRAPSHVSGDNRGNKAARDTGIAHPPFVQGKLQEIKVRLKN
jgi:hypothetical protein